MHEGAHLLQTVSIALFAAVVLQILAARLKFPAIVLLLFGGIILGPEFTGLINPDNLKSGLETVISLAVAVILFEGGMTLDLDGMRKAPRVIWRMLTVGVVITLFGITAAIMLLFGYDFGFAILASSLVVVTGPTVIGPILRRLRVGDRLHNILHWEGVLIDPIGVFIALGCFEWMVSDGTTLAPVGQFLGRIGLGIVVGLVAGILIGEVIKREWIHEEHDNLFVLSAALFTFGVCDSILTETGILAVTVAGFVLGLRKLQRLRGIRKFKLEITELAIGVLFILLAARLDLSEFTRLGSAGIWLLLIILFVVRPLNVAISSYRTSVNLRERLFLCWMAPRGIIAASMAALFALTLSDATLYPHVAERAWFLEVFAFAVIGTTVILQGLTAPYIAQLLGVRQPNRRTWMIVGARSLGRSLAQALSKADVPTILVDINGKNVRRAMSEGLNAVEGDILNVNLFEDRRFFDVGSMLCASGNAALDELACHRWQAVIPSGRAFKLWEEHTADDLRAGTDASPSGVPVWNGLGALKHLELDLELDQTEITAIDAGIDAGINTDDTDDVTDRNWTPLFRVRGGAALIIPKNDEVPKLEEDDQLVVLTHAPGPMAPLLRGFVWLKGRNPNLEGAFEELLGEAARLREELDTEALLRDLIDRSEATSAYVGHGVAIATTFSPIVRLPFCVAGRFETALEEATFDDQSIKVIFLLISPVGKAELHLNALGDLAQQVSDEELIRAVLDAQTPDEALKRIRDLAR